MRTRKRRWYWRLLRWLVPLIVIGVAGYLVRREFQFAANEEELRAAIAETDALDPEWRWDQIQARRATIPDDQNGAVVTAAA